MFKTVGLDQQYQYHQDLIRYPESQVQLQTYQMRILLFKRSLGNSSVRYSLGSTVTEGSDCASLLFRSNVQLELITPTTGIQVTLNAQGHTQCLQRHMLSVLQDNTVDWVCCRKEVFCYQEKQGHKQYPNTLISTFRSWCTRMSELTVTSLFTLDHFIPLHVCVCVCVHTCKCDPPHLRCLTVPSV